MNLQKNIIWPVRKFYGRHNQKIWSVAAGLAVIAAVGSAINETPRAQLILEEHKKKIEAAEDKTKAKFEAGKDLAVCYSKTLIFTAIAIGSVAGVYKISMGKQAALMASYKASEAALKEFTEKGKELLGERKIEAIKDAVVAEKVQKEPVPKEFQRNEAPESSEFYSLNDYTCWDEFSGRYFKSTRTKIEKAMVKASSKVVREMFIPLNYIYDELGLMPCEAGNVMGYNSDDLVNGEIPVRFSAVETDDYGPVLVVSLRPNPCCWD